MISTDSIILAQLLNRQWLDKPTMMLLVAGIGSLVVALVIGRLIKRQTGSTVDPAIARSFNRRVVSWLTICVLLASTLLFNNKLVVVIFFGLVSFWALREFITMTPTRRADHRTLFFVFFLFTPLQYVLVGIDEYRWYTIVIPVYASLFIAARIAFTGDTKRFLERTAKIQFGLLICVYALSHAPALLNMKLKTWNNVEEEWVPWNGSPAGLLFFFILMVQVSDLFQFVWDRLAGRHVIATEVNSTKTWEGLIGAVCCTAIIGTIVQWIFQITPFTEYGAGCMALIISVMATSGTMTMSAIKRDRGIQDYGTLIQGHSGVLDRIDSICFAAPIFFHVTRFFLLLDE